MMEYISPARAYKHHYRYEDVQFDTYKGMMSHASFEPKAPLFYPDEFYNQLNSGIFFIREPVKTLDQLYADRAWWLRRHYDYIVLFFSGGNDSCNVIETFNRCNIHLDEICTLTYSSSSSDIKKAETHYMMGGLGMEVEMSAVPLAKEYLKTMPRTIFTILDREKLYNKLYDNSWTNIPIEEDNLLFDPYALIRGYHQRWDKRWENMINIGKRVCFLYGKEKVLLNRDVKGWYFQYNNSQFRRHILDSYTELFYTHPYFIDIHKKQAFEIIRKINDTVFIKKHFFGNYDPLARFVITHSRKFEEEYAKIIYSKTPSKFLTLKEGDLLLLRKKTQIHKLAENIDIVPKLLKWSDLFTEDNRSAEEFLTTHVMHLIFSNQTKMKEDKIKEILEHLGDLFKIRLGKKTELNHIIRTLATSVYSDKYYLDTGAIDETSSTNM